MAGTASVLVGIDVGGTKTHARIERGGEVLLDRVFPSATWRTGPTLGCEQNADALLAHFTEVQFDADSVLVLGAHGVDTRQTAMDFERCLSARFPGRVTVVNDAVLVGPAAGFSGSTLAMIVGTGSIVVASSGTEVTAVRGGHGFLLGDEGSAPALVRDLARALLRAEDEGTPDPIALAHLADAFGVPESEEREEDLALTMHGRVDIAGWGGRAPAVFAAAEAGSELADLVIREHAHALARLVYLHLASGVEPEALVIAGGVVTNQPRFLNEIVRVLRRSRPELKVVALADPPVEGALRLARAASERRGS